MSGSKSITKKDVNKVLLAVVSILPFPILLFACMAIVNNEGRFFPLATYILMAINHIIRLYLHITKYNTDNMVKKVWLDSELHYLFYIFAAHISLRKPYLFFIDVAIMYTQLCFQVIKDQVAPRFPDLKESLSSLCDSVLKLEYLNRLRAIIEVFLIFYFFFAALFTFSIEVFAAFLVYFFLVNCYMMVVDQYHRWLWNWVDDTIDNFAKKQGEAGKNIKKVCDVFKYIPRYAKQFYPLSFLDKADLALKSMD